MKLNDELSYRLIKYIWKKDSYNQIENDHLKQDDSDTKSNHDINLEILFWNTALKLKNNEELKSKLDASLNKITIQPKKNMHVKA